MLNAKTVKKSLIFSQASFAARDVQKNISCAPDVKHAPSKIIVKKIFTEL